MKAQDHPEFPGEQATLRHTLAALTARMEELAQAEITTAYEDAAETLLMQYRAEYRALKGVSNSPYFARIDFVPYNREQVDTHYIGKKGFEHGDAGVIDWRAPLAALFYKGKPGEVRYASPAGAIRGLMQLKRNLDVTSQQLVTIADEFDIRDNRPEAAVDTTEPGAYLREKLAARRDPYLQEIIATIQAHQYDLIEANARQALVVQGVAGSGKTSIALHRLAYLLHPGNAENVEARRCIIFGPNRLFLSYIGLVLPELDIAQVTQTTLVDWACEQLGLDPKRVADKTLDDMLSSNVSSEARAAGYRRSQLRNSHNMGRLLERYIERRRRLSFPTSGLAYPNIGPLRVTARLTHDQIAEVHRQNAELPLNRHRERFAELMKARLARAYDEAVGQKLEQMPEASQSFASQVEQLREQAAQLQRLAILARGLNDGALKNRDTAGSLAQGAAGLLELAAYYERQADAAFMRAKRTRDEVYADHTWRQAIARLNEQLAGDLNRYWPPLDPVKDSLALLANRRLLAELGEGLFAPDEIALLHQKESDEAGAIDLSDLPAMHFLHALAEGVTPRYDHVVIDEVQDTSRLQLETVRRFSRNGSFTVLGDLPQSIYAHRGIASWEEARAAFEGIPCGYHEITISYRTSYEITTFANGVLRSLAKAGRGVLLAEPFARHADPPQLHALDDESQLPQAIASSVKQVRDQGYENVAIITKTADAAVSLAVALYDHLDTFEVIESAEVEYHGGLVLLPVHLAKGMEFEAALVVGADDATYTENEFDGRLLYVAVTRALHMLHVFWAGRASPHLKSVVGE